MPLRGLFILLAFAGVAGKAAGQDARLSDREWRALADGATVTYSANGVPAGREYYYPGEYFAIFQTTDGRCVEGPWAYDDGRFCFWYAEHFQCFAYFRKDGALWSRADKGAAALRIDSIEPGYGLDCAP